MDIGTAPGVWMFSRLCGGTRFCSHKDGKTALFSRLCGDTLGSGKRNIEASLFTTYAAAHGRLIAVRRFANCSATYAAAHFWSICSLFAKLCSATYAAAPKAAYSAAKIRERATDALILYSTTYAAVRDEMAVTTTRNLFSRLCGDTGIIP